MEKIIISTQFCPGANVLRVQRMQADEGYMSEDYLDKAQVHNFTPLCPPGERCTDQDWMVKIKDFKPSYQGGGGGGGGATFIFKVAPSTLITWSLWPVQLSLYMF